MIGAMLGLCLGGGVALVASSWLRTRRPALVDRMLPYLRDVHTSAPSEIVPVSTTGAVFGPSLRRGAAIIDRIIGGSASVEARLNRLGRQQSLSQFRARQLIWGLVALCVCVALSVLWFAGRGSSALPLLIFCLVGFGGGIISCDNALSAAVKAHEQRMGEEFPTVADLLALAVAAGESPVSGLERVVMVCHGDLAVELERVLADIRTGTSIQRAFDQLAVRTGVPSISRFAEGLAVAIERGTPLVDVLHAQAADVRDSSRRELIELGGRKEVAMMLPVVFLILPITVIFAFYPGLVGLHMTSGM